LIENSSESGVLAEISLFLLALLYVCTLHFTDRVGWEASLIFFKRPFCFALPCFALFAFWVGGMERDGKEGKGLGYCSGIEWGWNGGGHEDGGCKYEAIRLHTLALNGKLGGMKELDGSWNWIAWLVGLASLN
jgi:hypothetical protein